MVEAMVSSRYNKLFKKAEMKNKNKFQFYFYLN